MIELTRKPRVFLWDDCWLFIDQRGNCLPFKYATVRTKDGRNMPAHRWAWQERTGSEIPSGYAIHHACFRKRCINPDHLECITRQENSAIGQGDGKVVDRDWARLKRMAAAATDLSARLTPEELAQLNRIEQKLAEADERMGEILRLTDRLVTA